MKTATLSGVPLALQRDSWWMDGRKASPPDDGGDTWQRDMRGPMLLLALLAFGDAMIWQITPGLSLAAFGMALVGAAVLMAPSLQPKRVALASVTAIAAVAPTVELVQPLSLLLMAVGLITSLCLIAEVPLPSLFRGVLRFLPVSLAMAFRQSHTAVRSLSIRDIGFHRLLKDWFLPCALGFVFLILLAGANPVVSTWGRNIDWPYLTLSRALFWLGMVVLILISLIAHGLTDQLMAPQQAASRPLPAFFNAPAVTRSLVLFNILFAIQTGMDLTFLTGSTALPYGMTYAEYAHRGAYPLLVTALLAGAFAVLARPFSDESRALRVMMLVWLGQTLLLVGSSALRLETYIDAYGLTRLRFAAAIWMSVVAMGLGLVIWQVTKRHRTGWMLARCTALGLGVLYACAFINIDGLIARHNLTNDITRDDHYACVLGEAAVPEILRYQTTSAHAFCWNRYQTPVISTPTDWREWGFRNWRLRNSLRALETETLH